jgi:hypothetical protein
MIMFPIFAAVCAAREQLTNYGKYRDVLPGIAVEYFETDIADLTHAQHRP